MIRNKLAAAIAAIGALQAGVVGALGMGDLTLNSALNQPLDAEIRLNNTKDLDRTQVLIKMASPTDFDNAGVSLDYSLTTVKFNVILDGDGGGIIKVTTREPIIEPYLNFLVETRWPTGRMLREYTVLPSSIQENTPEKEFLKKAAEALEENVEDPAFKAGEFAASLHMSLRSLQRKLKAVADRTPQNFINEFRMMRAAELLTGTSYSVTDIAFKVGFEEPTNFSRTFRKHYEISPSKYRSER